MPRPAPRCCTCSTAAGTSLAAADWKQPGTTVGQDLSFRPYVHRCHATRARPLLWRRHHQPRPGYYLSYALRRGERPRGVAAVKVNIAEAERAWRKLPGNVLLIDERGVVILATRRTTGSTGRWRRWTPTQRADVQRSRPYGEAALQPMDWTATEALAADVAARLAGRRRTARLDAPLNAAPLAAGGAGRPGAGARRGALRRRHRRPGDGGAAAGRGTLWQRRRAVRQQAGQPGRAAGGARQPGVAGWWHARPQLRAAQDDLVHAGKMAALGQMSAGMVHELNQPLTAMRTLSDNAGVLLDQQPPRRGARQPAAHRPAWSTASARLTRS